VWGRLAKRPVDEDVRIAFESYANEREPVEGSWNIAHNPDDWELMLKELPAENLGLKWEPCHQFVYLIDPILNTVASHTGSSIDKPTNQRNRRL
jgi:sugar phosphate isomerase/epimerase